MLKAAAALGVLLALWAAMAGAQPSQLEDIYTTRALVTGSDERNRPLGFRLCFADVLVKASGDASLLGDSRVDALAQEAGRLVARFSYGDRLEGKPIHDEQGTYDRPFFLTCQFDPAKIDAVLATLGRKPWLGDRPRLAMLLLVRGRNSDHLLASDGEFEPNMRESLALAAARYGLAVKLPSLKALDDNQVTAGAASGIAQDRLTQLAKQSGGDIPILGSLEWSDAALGWIATWSLDATGRPHRWQVRGVNYDEAFRDAVRGAAQVLSGNGEP